jgi:hypothetical protein
MRFAWMWIPVSAVLLASGPSEAVQHCSAKVMRSRAPLTCVGGGKFRKCHLGDPDSEDEWTPPVCVEAIVATRPIEALGEGILHGPPGLDEVQLDLAAVGPAMQLLAANSGPLSTTIVRGKPRVVARRSSCSVARSAGSERSTRIAGHSRVKSSTMFKSRSARPSSSSSDMKSIDQRSFAHVGAARRSRGAVATRLRRRLRMRRPSLRRRRWRLAGLQLDSIGKIGLRSKSRLGKGGVDRCSERAGGQMSNYSKEQAKTWALPPKKKK